MAKQTKKQAKSAISKVNKQITIGFIIVAVILVSIIGYFSLSKANIHIVLKRYPINSSTELEILPEVKSTLHGSNILPGIINNFTKSASKNISPKQKNTKVGKAGGTVTIYNKYVKNQPLIATTRLLTPNGLLFRLTENVVVPAGGSVVAKVEADKEGSEYEIKPTKFTIPGLWEGLQDKIYAQSNEVMSTIRTTEKIVSLADLENAKVDLLKQIISETKKEYSQPENYLIIKTKITSASSSASVGDKIDNFNFNIEANVTTIQINKKDLEQLAVNNLKIDTPKDQEYLSHDPESIEYDLVDFNNKLPSATIRVKISGLANPIIKKINKKDILGFSKEDTIKYFKKIKGVKNITVNLSPGWVKSIPPLKDHVHIEILK